MKLIVQFMLVLSVWSVYGSELRIMKNVPYLEFNLNEKSFKLTDLSPQILAINGFTIGHSLNSHLVKTNETHSNPKATILFLTSNKENLDSLGPKIDIIDDEPRNFDLLISTYEKDVGVDSVKYFKSFPDVENDFQDLRKNCAKYPSVFYIIQLNDQENIATMTKSMDSIIHLFHDNCVQHANDLISYLLSTNNVRSRRQAPNADPTILNVAEFYSENYSAAFNIFFWTSLILAIAVAFTASLLWYMDPGTDTVIYRMTSQRIKKDN